MSKEIAKYFNYKNYFRAKGIDFKESGKDISSNWTGIYECPECRKPDYHFAINNNFKTVNCWVCGYKTSIFGYIMKIERVNFDKALEIVKKYIDPTIQIKEEKIERGLFCEFPKGVQNEDIKLLSKYLKKRKISKRNKFIRKYDLHFNKKRNEIYIPFFLNGEMVTYKKRRIGGKEYINCPIEKSSLDPKTTLFNIDRVQAGGKMMVCEGFFDSARFGDGAVDTSGTLYTAHHVLQIKQKEPKCVFVCYDNEDAAQVKAMKLCNKLSSLGIPEVENIILKDYCDIGEMPESEIIDLKKSLGFERGIY